MELSGKMREYLKNTPREQVLKDWEKSKVFDNVGPTVGDFLLEMKRVGRRFRLGRQIGRRYVGKYLPEVNRQLSEPFESVRCITFDPEAQNALPDHIKARMKENQEKAGININNQMSDVINYFISIQSSSDPVWWGCRWSDMVVYTTRINPNEQPTGCMSQGQEYPFNVWEFVKHANEDEFIKNGIAQVKSSWKQHPA